jgi:squalene-associated FAD-dependent desaturase
VAEIAPARVAVVGGGWAGCAAAVTLAAAGLEVTLLEQAKTLGGRARRIVVDGIALDNGQHVLLGAYRQTLALIDAMHRAGDGGRLLHRMPLTLRSFGERLRDEIELTASNARAPLHLAGGVLRAKGLSWRERLGLLADFRQLTRPAAGLLADEAVTSRFSATPRRAFAQVWQPLCLAALNTPPERASANTFAHVLRSALGGTARDSDLLVPAVDLSACFPDAAARFVEAHGGAVRRGVTVRGIANQGGVVALGIGAAAERFRAAIVAVGPHQLAPTLGDNGNLPGLAQHLEHITRFTYESITTIYLGLAHRIPFAAPVVRLDDAPGQWAFDRSGALAGGSPPGTSSLVAVVISASGPHDGLDQRTLAANVEAQLRRRMPRLPAITFSRVIAERRATYACAPGLSRPAGGRVDDGLYVAGDYCDGQFPATLESATRSGVAAANELIADFAGAAAARGSTRAP